MVYNCIVFQETKRNKERKHSMCGNKGRKKWNLEMVVISLQPCEERESDTHESERSRRPFKKEEKKKEVGWECEREREE